MDIASQLRQQVDDIAALLEQCQCEFLFGEEERQQWRTTRHVAFVPRDGDEGYLEEPIAHGDVAISDATDTEPAKFAQPLKVVPVRVTAYIVAETETAAWVLWQNVVNASRQVMGKSSVAARFRLPTQEPGESSPLHDGSWYVEQDFMWKIHMWKGIVAMPDIKRDTRQIVGAGDLVPMETYAELSDAPDIEPITDGEIPRPQDDALDGQFGPGNPNE